MPAQGNALDTGGRPQARLSPVKGDTDLQDRARHEMSRVVPPLQGFGTFGGL